MTARNPHLRQFWFRTKGFIGFGVTAYSREDAKNLMLEAAESMGVTPEIEGVIEDVQVGELDQNHIVPNIGTWIFRGVWYPNIEIC